MKEMNSAQSQDDRLTRKWLLIIILCMTVPFVLFAFLGHDPGRGRAAAICTGVIMIAARARWDLRKHRWFWVVLTIISTFHVLLVLLIPWTSKSYPGLILFPVGVLDYALVYGIIKLVEKVAKGAAPQQSA